MEGRQGSGIQEFVRQGNLAESSREHARAHQEPGDSLSQSADDGVVLRHDHHAARPRCLLEDRGLVERLDRGYVQNTDVDVVVREGLSRL